VATTENPHAGQGMVVLDIGGEIGALVVLAPGGLAGAEIEICPTGRRHLRPDDGAQWWDGDWRAHEHAQAEGPHTHRHGPAWPHVAVLPRQAGGGTQHAAVFPGLREGSYDLWVRPDGPTALTVAAPGGQVTEVAWPDS